ncbi:PTS system mannose/fructose/sorbose family transporter subunit IID [Lactobacillus bombicola]|uniref:PTS system mannose/fructose/sorbose family transporter subunit IID n=1 Tax=Lactobacillus bombicola TaxID=1505723 RepID=UPI000E576A3A|nr:PTS system mannose/fructose/sorbose family transporter subunit IID [Lactobacillus bombicola]RHW49308.1 PTS mannose transporter subunit IID [Lactobacillus bombicola]
MAEQKHTNKQLRHKFWQFFWRSWAIQTSWNYERQMNMGFMYGMAPTIDEIYGEKPDSPEKLQKKKEAYHRHMEFFNCTPQLTSFVLGLSSAMEEEYAENPDTFDPESINSVKTSLMGPLSGIGDSFFQGTIKIIAFGLGVNMAQQGNIFGPILAMIISIIPSAAVTYWGGKWGYLQGKKNIQKLIGNGTINRIMSLMNVVGLMVIGAMIATMIGITTPIKFGKTFVLQTTLDSIFPQMLSLTFTFGMFYLIKKKVNTAWIMVICIVGGILLSVLGIFN